MINQNNPNGNNNPYGIRNLNDASDVKLNEDQYEVYVNGNFVGRKTLRNQGEKLSDIDGFIRIQGINDFTASLDGDHYTIHTNDQDSDITDALSVYFSNR